MVKSNGGLSADSVLQIPSYIDTNNVTVTKMYNGSIIRVNNLLYMRSNGGWYSWQALPIAALSIVNSMLANSTIDLTAKVFNQLPDANISSAANWNAAATAANAAFGWGNWQTAGLLTTTAAANLYYTKTYIDALPKDSIITGTGLGVATSYRGKDSLFLTGGGGGGSYVDLSTAQTIAGVKTFQGSTATDAGAAAMIFKNSSGTTTFELRALASAANVGLGVSSFPALTTGANNTGVGYQAGLNTTTGSSNTFFGYQAGGSNTAGGNNNFVGSVAGYNNTTGNFNTFAGYSSGYANTTGTNNVFTGFQAGNANTTGNAAVAIGTKAAANIIAFNNTTVIGQGAARTIANGSTLFTNTYNCVYIGDNAHPFKDTATNEIVFGANAIGAGNNTLTLGNNSNIGIFGYGSLNLYSYGTGTNTGTAAYNLAVTASGKVIEVSTTGGTATTAFNTITATGGQTAFSFPLVPATASNFMLFKNGMLILNGVQYTASGNTITLSTGATAGDVIALQRLQ